MCLLQLNAKEKIIKKHENVSFPFKTPNVIKCEESGRCGNDANFWLLGLLSFFVCCGGFCPEILEMENMNMTKEAMRMEWLCGFFKGEIGNLYVVQNCYWCVFFILGFH